jgi:fructose-1-phosphate kinase PfkB-like protein
MFDSQYPMTSTTSHHSPNRSSLGAGDAMLASISVRYMWVMRYKKAFRFTKKAPFRSDKTGAALGC